MSGAPNEASPKMEEESERELLHNIAQEHYKFLNSQVAARDLRPVDYLKNYVQFVTAVVGGSIWITLQNGYNSTHAHHFVILSNMTMALGSIVTIVLVADNFFSWFRYRTAQSKLGNAMGQRVPEPKYSAGYWMEMSIILSAVAVCAMFFWYNPLQDTQLKGAVPSPQSTPENALTTLRGMPKPDSPQPGSR